MAAVSFVVELDGFQHGTDPFTLKSMAIACARTQSTYTRVFDTSDLLKKSKAALHTYRHQTAHHGFHLASPGLPQSTQLLVLFHALQEALFQLLEVNEQMPPFLLLWVKGISKVEFLQHLLGDHETPALLLVRNLEDVKCPPARKLRSPTWEAQEDEEPLMTYEKASLFAEWLVSKGIEKPRFLS